MHATGEPGKDRDGKEKKKVWVIARQHPGESMAGQQPPLAWLMLHSPT